MENTAFPSVSDVLKLCAGSMNNLPFNSDDVRRSVKIYGRELASIKGKTTNTTSPTVTIERSERLEKDVTIYVDILFIDTQRFFLSISSNGLITIKPLDSGTTKAYESALAELIKTYRSRSYRIIGLVLDPCIGCMCPVH